MDQFELLGELVGDMAAGSVDSFGVQEAVKRTLTQAQAEYYRRDLREFLKATWHLFDPKKFLDNWHLDAICDHLAYVTFGDIRNLMINVPPRMTKSTSASVAWPVWHWLLDAGAQFLCASYAQELAVRDAVKSRRLIESAWFRERYGDVFYLDPTDNRKHRYVNNHGGHRISTSVGGKTTGEGGDILLIDDPHNMKDVYSDAIRHTALSWWDNSMRSRLNDPTTGQKVLIGQRSHDADLFGHILQVEDERWEVLELPMEYEPAKHCITFFNAGRGHQVDRGPIFGDPRKERGELLNVRRFGPEEVKAERKAMSQRDYSAQFQQDPTSGGGLILKKKWWGQWVYPSEHQQAGEPMPYPEFFEVISIYDTAFEKEEENDFSARITAGLFEYSHTGRAQDTQVHAMLLERFNDRVEFPDLKTEAIGHHQDWNPDRTLIEKKASGHSLIQEMRRAGVPLWGVKPGAKDKVFRAHMVAQILKDGRLWYIPRKWAYQVIDQCAKFPVGEYDDLVDCIVMLLAYIRRMNLIELDDDERDGEMNLFAQPTRKFYGA